ncbi:MAG: efflux RND transporter periplasmic adaptor subunit [Myxococcota bacterium]
MTVVIAWFALVGCGSGASGVESSIRPVVVRTESVSESGEAAARSYTGIVRSADEAVLSFAVGGRIARLTVDAGDSVEAGQPIARIEGERFGLTVDAARGRLAELEERLSQAIRDRDRAARLAEIEAAAFEELEQRKSGVTALERSVESVRAQLAEARWQQDETVLTAPFTGTITARMADEGAVVSPGQPVVALRSLDAVEVEVALVEADTSSVNQGDSLTVSFPLAEREPVTGRVQSVSRAATTGTRGFPLVVALPQDSDIVPGLTARVAVPAGESTGVVVPLAAIVSPFGDRTEVVRVLDDGTTESVSVRVGRARGASIVVEGDLRPGDEVIVAGHIGLVVGERVERAEVTR